MLVESDGQRGGLMLPGIVDRLADDLLVAQMHAVEKADGQANLATSGPQFGWRVNDLHSFRSRQRQERNDALLQFARSQLEHVFKRDRLRNIEFARSYAAK